MILWLLVRKTWDYAWVLNDGTHCSSDHAADSVVYCSHSIFDLCADDSIDPNPQSQSGVSATCCCFVLRCVLGVRVTLHLAQECDVTTIAPLSMAVEFSVLVYRVTVATGIDLPIKIVIPYFKGVGSSMIGLGDLVRRLITLSFWNEPLAPLIMTHSCPLVLPGLFSAFLLRFDKGRNDTNNLYFTTCTLGYATGLALCLLCVVFFGAAQPAMLYISPCTLLLVYIQVHYPPFDMQFVLMRSGVLGWMPERVFHVVER